MVNPRTTTPTTVPGIPKPPANLDAETKRYLEALTEAIEIRLGRRGDTRDRAITLRELIDSGLAKELLNNPFDPNNPGSTFTTPTSFDDDVPYLETPNAPTGFAVYSGYETIILRWDFPFYANHSATLIYRYATDSIGDAKIAGEISRASGRVFVDPVGEDKSYYYWIAHQTTDGKIGPFNSTSGTLGETELSKDSILDHLVASIPAVAFATGLEPIEVVDALPNVSGYTGPTLVFLTTDGKLYRYVNGAWTAAVATVDLTGTIATLQIAALAVTNAKIAVNAITGDVIAAGAIVATKIANDAVTNAKIATNAITGDVIAASAITTTKILDGAIETAKLDANAVTAAKIAAGTITAAQIAAGTITATQILANTITATQILANTITAAQIAVNTITANEIATNAVTADAILAGSIQAGAIAASAINATNLIVDDVIVGDHIQGNTITATHIAAGTITATQIAGATITGDKIVANTIEATKIKLDNATIEGNAAGLIQIKDLGVDTAQINNLAVETLKIAGEAATVPYGTSSNLGVTIGYATGENITTWTAIDGGGLAQNYSSNVPSQVSIIVTQNFIGGTSSSGQADNVIDMALRISSDGGSTWLTGTGTDLGRVVHSTLEDYAFTLTSGFTFAPTGTGNVLIRLYARKLFNQSSWKTKNAHVVVLGTRK
mgnify:CR=1 FL=1